MADGPNSAASPPMHGRYTAPTQPAAPVSPHRAHPEEMAEAASWRSPNALRERPRLRGVGDTGWRAPTPAGRAPTLGATGPRPSRIGRHEDERVLSVGEQTEARPSPRRSKALTGIAHGGYALQRRSQPEYRSTNGSRSSRESGSSRTSWFNRSSLLARSCSQRGHRGLPDALQPAARLCEP